MVVGVVYKGVSEYTVCILYGNWSHAYCTVVFTAVSCTRYVVLYLFLLLWVEVMYSGPVVIMF